MTQKHNRDTFATHIGSVSGPAHACRGDIIIQHWDARGITAADLDALSCLFTDLRERVATKAPPNLAAAELRQRFAPPEPEP